MIYEVKFDIELVWGVPGEEDGGECEGGEGEREGGEQADNQSHTGLHPPPPCRPDWECILQTQNNMRGSPLSV